MIDQLSADERLYIENTYGPIEVNPDYQPTQRETDLGLKKGVTLFTGNRIAYGVHQETGNFILTNIETLS
jgi:hypothetical protein